MKKEPKMYVFESDERDASLVSVEWIEWAEQKLKHADIVISSVDKGNDPKAVFHIYRMKYGIKAHDEE